MQISIEQGVNNNEFSAESSLDLLRQDIVQLHARKWCNRRSDVISGSGDVDLLLWPRKDIERVECKVFSRWSHDKASPYMLLKVTKYRCCTLWYNTNRPTICSCVRYSQLLGRKTSQSRYVFLIWRVCLLYKHA